MSPTALLLILFMSFATIGVAASILMGRRGHNPFAWLLLGAILGPLVIPVIAVAVDEERMRQRHRWLQDSPGVRASSGRNARAREGRRAHQSSSPRRNS